MATGYAIAGGLAGKQRLDHLARVMAPSTISLLDRVGIPVGSRCVDVGCGGGHVARELANRAGEEGWVVGIDTDEPLLELAAADVVAADLTNVEFRRRDAAQLTERAYDVAYARLLLSHVSDPEGVLDAMVDSLRPGGSVIVEDLDVNGYSSYPPTAVHDRWVEIYRATIIRRGGDPHIGMSLPTRLLSAGLQDIGIAVTQRLSLGGDASLVGPMALDAMTDSVVGEGIAAADEVGELVRVLYEHAGDPATLMGLPRIVQAWGRKPPLQ